MAKIGRVVRMVLVWTGAALLLAIVLAVIDGWTAFGHRATGARRERMVHSPQWKDGHFENPEPLVNDLWRSLAAMRDPSPPRRPAEPMPTSPVDPKTFAQAPPSGLRVTWLGHSTTLVEIDGYRVLTDPVWSERVGPIDGIGPTRWFEPLVPLADLPHIDAVVISHDHYDHCDYPTLAAMKSWDTTFIVPLGVGAHLAYWGIPEARIVELDWWESTPIGDLSIVATPARHASGRTVLDKDATLWAGYAFVGSKHRVYFSGDTGLFPAMNEIGAKLGPFDLTMIEAGQYHPTWPDWHLGPEQAVMAHRMVRGRVLLPIHWGLLELAYHGWTEPVERTLTAAARSESTVVTPRPGQSFEPDTLPAVERWWPAIPWETGEQRPVVSTGVPAAALPR
ncbi:MBL fold metallo-hydrolase [Vulgatibacter incomptus]|nr:MBL fold metallo-hydrolase [Vulgatibacter incomptus]